MLQFLTLLGEYFACLTDIRTKNKRRNTCSSSNSKQTRKNKRWSSIWNTKSNCRNCLSHQAKFVAKLLFFVLQTHNKKGGKTIPEASLFYVFLPYLSIRRYSFWTKYFDFFRNSYFVKVISILTIPRVHVISFQLDARWFSYAPLMIGLPGNLDSQLTTGNFSYNLFGYLSREARRTQNWIEL